MNANKIAKPEDGKSWWLRLGAGELAEKVVLAIELDMPKRCILSQLEDVEKISELGEYEVFNGKFNGEKISVVYHGSGSFSISTAIEELAVLGATAILRLGSSGAISTKMSVGDVVVCDGTIRDDRLMLDYVPAEYPAVADSQMVRESIAACREEHLKFQEGITVSTATFYPGSGYETAVGILDPTPYERIKLWERLGALTVDIETSTVLIMSRLFNIKGASLLGISNHCLTGEGGFLTDETICAMARAGFKVLTRL